ncbi:MAG: hypothetical protein GKR89_27260 [Candidatus Latescibacteria bacterium]|nr:hypothetical protein [Candidatus Latescibacterota bacterium]
MDKDQLNEELQALYEEVPATRCAQSGECCVLTADEYDGNYATMFPLWLPEYLNIVAYVKEKFSPERQASLLNSTEERPRQCPFLGEDHGCTIYPVRPLICRTYAVMDHDSIGEQAQQNMGTVPQDWIDGFVLRESNMVCPRVTVTEPEKLERHARNLIASAYEQALTSLCDQVELGDARRKSLFQRLSGRTDWPQRWSWGGFNSVHSTPLKWLRTRFSKYWRRAELPDMG